jgi:hypothetical protein
MLTPGRVESETPRPVLEPRPSVPAGYGVVRGRLVRPVVARHLGRGGVPGRRHRPSAEAHPHGTGL